MNLPSRRDVIVGLSSLVALPVVARAAKVLDAGGLVGDGRTDDLPAFRALLAEAERNGGGVIKLRSGRYRLVPPPRQNSALVVPANVRIEGAGTDRTTLSMADGAHGHVINAPYGWVEFADFTIDGNADRRPGEIGHNLRFEGEHLRAERLRIVNSASYGMGIGERRFAKDVLISHVDIENAGNDGIDMKNRLGRTEGIRIEDVTVRGFGRPDPKLDRALIGTEQDDNRGKAGIDLRGHCQVQRIQIIGVRRGRTGFRFRPGEAGEGNGAGAHGSTATDVVVRGAPQQSIGLGIGVFARDVGLRNVDARGVGGGLWVGETGLNLEGGFFGELSNAALLARATGVSTPDRMRLANVTFSAESKFVFKDVKDVTFDRCRFGACRESLRHQFVEDSRIHLNNCEFEHGCR